MDYLLLIPVLMVCALIIYRTYLHNKITIEVDTSKMKVNYWWRGDIVHYFNFNLNVDLDVFRQKKRENLSIAIENVNKIKKLKSKI